MNKKLVFNCILCLLPAFVGLVARVIIFNNLLIDGQKMHSMNLLISNLEIENKKLKFQNAKMSSYDEISARALGLGMQNTSISFIEITENSLASNLKN